MATIVLKEPWATINLDTTNGRVFVQQEWQYTWILFNPTVPAWTTTQQSDFHKAVDRQIWGAWSNKVRLRVSGAAEFSRRFARSGVGLNFDIRKVTSPGQWSVTVRKMPAGSTRTTYRSNVHFPTRRIDLDTADVIPGRARNALGISAQDFRSPAHEFGHALGQPDEYRATSVYLTDIHSVMNIGGQVRARHLTLVLASLNTMLPDVTFATPVNML